MITVAEADRRIAATVQRGPSEPCALEHAHGRWLHTAVRADRPSPPFDRVMMDGFALAHEGWRDGRRNFEIQGSVGAGHQSPALSTTAHVIEVMTGGVLPEGCDAVLPVEWCSQTGDRVHVDSTREVNAGLYVHRRASDGEAGRVVIEAGTRLDPAALAVAATEGAVELSVNRRPRIYLLTTGDEVVDVAAQPADWQIRGSHAHALRALLETWGSFEWMHEHTADKAEDLRACLSRGLDFGDVLLTVGGVSRGRWDLVPKVLGDLGVVKHLHRVAQRPGKPLWFGTRHAQLVFGLPGNPVSALCSARRYVWPALDRWAGAEVPPPPRIVLDSAVEPLPDAARFVPVRRTAERYAPVPPQNSGSLHALVATDGFVECPPQADAIAAGTPLPYFGWNR